MRALAVEGSSSPERSIQEMNSAGQSPTFLSAASESLPCDLYGFLAFDMAGRVVHVSRSLMTGHKRETSLYTLNVLAVLAGLLEDAETATVAALSAWVRSAMVLNVEPSEPFVNHEQGSGRAVEAELHLVQQSWTLSLLISRAQAGSHRSRRSQDEDTLTGAANRAFFDATLDAALEISGPTDRLTVLFLDLDRFKAVNDTLGHAVGDLLLRTVGDRLRTALRQSDLLARLGGDEFGILLQSELTQAELTELSRRLIDLLQRPYLIDGHIINIGASAGIASAPEDGTTRDQLLRSADLALYHSKATGRGTFTFFAPFLQERAQERRAMEFALRKALILKQFELHYQPQIDVEKQTIIGLEALLRWKHPERGLLLPGDFLKLAEEIGLASAIGQWVVKTACKDAAGWSQEITVAVNVSAQQFESPTFSESVQQALTKAGISGERLEIEVTEEILQRDNDRVRSTLEELKEMGVHVAIDSFGTGLASLSQLVKFPFNKIKIDRSLIGSSQNDTRSRAVLRAISALGQTLGIQTLAEGVETSDQLANVRAEGCSTVQGFYYSRAVPEHDLAELLSSHLS
jgi:diguanylate cyclase (GGDEF)-like protein